MMFTHGAAFRLRLLQSWLRSQSAVPTQDTRKASVCYPGVSCVLYISAAPAAEMLQNSFVALFLMKRKLSARFRSVAILTDPSANRK